MTTITIPRELLERIKDRIHSSRLCEVNSMSSRAEARRLLNEALGLIDAELAKPAIPAKPFAYTTGVYAGRFTVEPVNKATVIPEGIALYLHPPAAQHDAPAWHDAPTVEGLWLNSINRRALLLSKKELAAWSETGARWYGPIPMDANAEGGAA